jgi:hypothetical protein
MEKYSMFEDIYYIMNRVDREWTITKLFSPPHWEAILVPITPIGSIDT